MAKGQVKKQAQPEDMIFALDIGTRSIIGMVGCVEEDKVRILAIEREDHTERAMIDGQIENIDKVAMLAKRVKRRLESRLKVKLSQVCVAAAGRALRTKRADFEMELPGRQVIDDETISRLEAGAISKAEKAFDEENEAEDDSRNFYLVGYTVCQYYLDQYLMSSLKDHRGKKIKADLIATFLPSEVIESLYTTMRKVGLEIASITLEPIAAINAAIPESLRLLNLVMVDIGAGTSDIAACTGGSVTGYTMATVAGDEVTEMIMKEYLVDFGTAEQMKAELETKNKIEYIDILGLEHQVSKEDILKHIQGASELLCREIAEKVLEVNGGAPSALFLAGGGSKLAGLKEGLTEALQMDEKRVAIAGNNFRASAYSDEYDLNNPEYATPLGIVVSSGLNMINDSFRVTLNGKSVKLFRSGSFTVLNLLMMNGYSFQDMLGRSGRDLVITLNGKRKVFYGVPAQPATLFVNQKEGKLSQIINAGDSIDFTPAVHGISARAFLGDIEGAVECEDITLNGERCSLETLLKGGDKIVMKPSKEQLKKTEQAAKPEEEKEENAARKEKSEIYRTEQAPDTMNWRQEELDFGEKEDAESVSGPEIEEEPTFEPDSEPKESVSLAFEPELEANEPPEPERKANAPLASEPELEANAQPEPERKENAPLGFEPEPEVNASSASALERKENASSVSEPETNATSVSRPVAGKAAASGLEVEKGAVSAFEEEHNLASEVAQEPALKKPSNLSNADGHGLPEAAPIVPAGGILFHLNGAPLRLPPKEGNVPYYLMDMIQYSGIDLKNPKGRIELTVNGEIGMFQQELKAGDNICIQEEREQ